MEAKSFEKLFQPKNTIFVDYMFTKNFFKNRIALFCGKHEYIEFDIYQQYSSFCHFTLLSSVTIIFVLQSIKTKH